MKRWFLEKQVLKAGDEIMVVGAVQRLFGSMRCAEWRLDKGNVST